MSRPLTALVAMAALVFTAACGSTPGVASASSPTPSPSASASPAASPSPSASPALTFRLNGVNGSTASGTILLTKGSGSFTVELKVTGLGAHSSHVSHVHAGGCSAPGGIKFGLNQVIADANGMADTRTQIPATFPPPTGHWYVVVHSGQDMQGPNAIYMLCGNLF